MPISVEQRWSKHTQLVGKPAELFLDSRKSAELEKFFSDLEKYGKGVRYWDHFLASPNIFKRLRRVGRLIPSLLAASDKFQYDSSMVLSMYCL